MGLAIVMGIKKTGGTLQLADNNPLSPIHYKNTVPGHQGN